MICSAFPAYTVEAVNALEDIGPVMRAMSALGIYNELKYGDENSRAHIEATWADWERKTGQKRPTKKPGNV